MFQVFGVYSKYLDPPKYVKQGPFRPLLEVFGQLVHILWEAR